MNVLSGKTTHKANQPTSSSARIHAAVKSHCWTVLLLALIMLLALGYRLYRLVPLETGLLYAQDADEGVYATTAQLALQGYLPYRDFFTPMPPVAIYLFAIVLRVFYHPWGSSTGLMALRYACVVCGLATVLLTYLAGRMVGGKWSGLLAGAIVAVDGIVAAQDRRAMLEAPTNMFSLLAIICYLCAVRQTSAGRGLKKDRLRLWVVGSGFFCALALLTKGTALIPPLVIALAILVRRRWQEGLWFVASVVGTYLLCTLVFVMLCPVEYIKQMYFFHLLRPWGGTVHPLARLVEIWDYSWSWATVRFALGGVAVAILAGRKLRRHTPFLVVLAWAGLLLLLLLGSRTYWATYFSQLAVPLAILGGTMLSNDLDHRAPGLLDYLPIPSRQSWPLLQILVLAALLVLGHSRLLLQYTTTKDALEQTKPAYVEIRSDINQHLPPNAPILAFETNYTFLSAYPPAGARDRSFFIDSYGEMLYRNLGIPDRSICSLLGDWLRQERLGTQKVFHQQPAQREVLAVFSRAPYVVLDGRALKQLTEETSTYIRNHSDVLGSAYDAELRVRVAE
jgi:4-amino-4-deoxy-L-arabinose transferase-like glycosyltransferase